MLLKKLGFAPEKLGFAPEKLGFATEKLGFAPENLQVRFWDLQVDILGRRPFGANLGVPKTYFCEELIFW